MARQVLDLAPGKDRGCYPTSIVDIKENKMITVDASGRVFMEAVSISPTRPKDSALQTWTRVEYKQDQAYANSELKSGRMPQAI